MRENLHQTIETSQWWGLFILSRRITGEVEGWCVLKVWDETTDLSRKAVPYASSYYTSDPTTLFPSSIFVFRCCLYISVVFVLFFFSFCRFYFSQRVARAKEMELRKSNIISPLCSLFFTSAVHYRVSDNSFALQGLGNDCRNIASPAQ